MALRTTKEAIAPREVALKINGSTNEYTIVSFKESIDEFLARIERQPGIHVKYVTMNDLKPEYFGNR